MLVPDDLRYSADHEWARLEGSSIRVGVTDYAQDALGDVIFVNLPAVGATLSSGASCGEVESTKSVSDIYSPVAGTVSATNQQLVDAPQLLNDDPYGAGWMWVLDPLDAGELATLMDASAYRALTEG